MIRQHRVRANGCAAASLMVVLAIMASGCGGAGWALLRPSNPDHGGAATSGAPVYRTTDSGRRWISFTPRLG